MVEIRGAKHSKEVRDIINLYFQEWNIDIEKEECNKNFIYRLSVNESYNKEEFYRILADALEEIMIEKYLDSFIYLRISKIFSQKYLHIVGDAVGKIKDEIKTSSLYLDEKIRMKEELIDYIQKINSIDIEGYMNFRLIDYVYILDIAIDKVMSNIREDIRVNEFVEMIGYIIESNGSKESILNIIIDGDKFTFKDAENNMVATDIINEIKENSLEVNPLEHEFILAAVISISPKRLVIHSNKDLDSFLMKTLRGVFGRNFIYCTGCNICKLDPKKYNGGKDEERDS